MLIECRMAFCVMIRSALVSLLLFSENSLLLYFLLYFESNLIH